MQSSFSTFCFHLSPGQLVNEKGVHAHPPCIFQDPITLLGWGPKVSSVGAPWGSSQKQAVWVSGISASLPCSVPTSPRRQVSCIKLLCKH